MKACKQCAGEMSGYNTHCIECCARLVMSTGMKNGNMNHDRCVMQQREMMFAAIEKSGSKLKRKQIADHIRLKHDN